MPPSNEPLPDEQSTFEFMDIGSESEDDLSPSPPENIVEAVVTGTDWTTEVILRQLEKGTIDLNPRFQRRNAWNELRQSRFIESLILGLPIPQIVLAVQKDRRGRYLVIDGKQRLLSLLHFAGPESMRGDNPPLKLRGLKNHPELNNKTYEDIGRDPRLANDIEAFQNQPIRTVVIKNWPDEPFLYMVFHRLNSGSVPLSPQELRQALHPGPFIDYVNDYTNGNTNVQQLLGSDSPDFRMRDVELMIRFIAFRRRLSDYRGDLKKFLDETCKHLNDSWKTSEAMVKQDSVDFEEAITTTVKIFGQQNAFRRWIGEKYESRFNRAVVDIMLYYFSRPEIREAAVKLKSQVESDFCDLCGDTEFNHALQTTTKSIPATFNRLRSWGEVLSKRLALHIPVPTLKGKRIKP